jgi:hypothetical protein
MKRTNKYTYIFCLHGLYFVFIVKRFRYIVKIQEYGIFHVSRQNKVLLGKATKNR